MELGLYAITVQRKKFASYRKEHHLGKGLEKNREDETPEDIGWQLWMSLPGATYVELHTWLREVGKGGKKSWLLFLKTQEYK